MSLKTREKWWDFLVMIGAQECIVNVSLVAYINSARDNEWSDVYWLSNALAYPNSVGSARCG
jgi:hypothetical protein